MIDRAALFGTPASHSRIGGTIRPSSNTLVAWLGIEPGTAPPMSSWWPKACTNATTFSHRAEDRHRDAEVGQVADPALGAVDVVVEEDVALAHLLDREVAGDGVDERGVRAAGQLAQQPVVDARAEVVGVADHRAAAGARDGGLHLHLHAGQRALHDLDQHGVGARPGVRGQRPERELGGCAPAHASLLVTMRLRYSSTRTSKPGWIGTVDPNSSTITGPVTLAPGAQVAARDDRGLDVPGLRVEADGPCRGFEARSLALLAPQTTRGRWISGLVIGPMPDTRRFTHSTCCEASPEKS